MKAGIISFLAILLFACTSAPETAKSPLVNKSSPPTKTSDNNNTSIKTFSLQNANKITPDDILEEVSFGGQGGGGYCINQTKLGIDKNSSNVVDWLSHIELIACGWEEGEQIQISIRFPDGNTTSKTVQAKTDWHSTVPYVDADYNPTIDSVPGLYIFTFRGNNHTIEYKIDVTIPNEPRIYYLNDIQAFYIYGLAPQENIRFFLYTFDGSSLRLTAWQYYAVDSQGHLIIKTPEESSEHFFAIGDVTGVIGYINILSHNDVASCSMALPSRLEVGKYAYVATEPPLDQRVRKGPGSDYSIVGYIAPGNSMKILDGPYCAYDGWVWWKVQSIKKPDLIGWTSEGDDVYWLIPCNSLNSCP